MILDKCCIDFGDGISKKNMITTQSSLGFNKLIEFHCHLGLHIFNILADLDSWIARGRGHAKRGRRPH